MRKARTWLAALLTAALLLSALPMAALAAAEEEPQAGPAEVQAEAAGVQTEAEEAQAEAAPQAETAAARTGAAEVSDFAELQAALADDAVESIKIVGVVTISENMEIDKPVLVGYEGSLRLADGVVVTSDVPMGQFSYEDGEHTWERIGAGMAAFLLWSDEEDGCYRELYGTMPENLNTLLTEYGAVSTAVLSGDVEITGRVGIVTLQMPEGNLTISGDVGIGTLHMMNGDLTIAENSSLMVDDGWVEGDLYIMGSVDDIAGNLGCRDEVYCNRLMVRWEEGNYGEMISMTPEDEYEVTFALQEYKDGEWVHTPVAVEDIQTDAPLTYGENEDHEGPTLMANGAAWGETYRVHYEDYSLRVQIELPELGCYSTPEASTDSFLRDWQYDVLADNVFYVCVNPDAWFMDPDSDFTVSSNLEVHCDREGSPVLGACQVEPVRDGVWKVAVTDCLMNVIFRMEVSNGNEDTFHPETGLWIDPGTARLVSSTQMLTEEGDVHFEDVRASVQSTISMTRGGTRDVYFYNLGFRDRDENGGWDCEWYCGQEGSESVKVTDTSGRESTGLTLADAGTGDGKVRITAGAAGTYWVYLYHNPEEMGEHWGDWVPVGVGTDIPGTEGLPMIVTVRSSSGGGSSGGGSSSGGTIISGGSGTTGGGTSSGKTPDTTTRTNADGSTTETKTSSSGTVTETTRYPDGGVTTVTTTASGDVTTVVRQADGTTGTTTEKGGAVSASARISASAAEKAAQSGGAVALPVEVPNASGSGSAARVEISLPEGAGKVKVEIPVNGVTPGTVAAIEGPGGALEIVRDSLTTRDGVTLVLSSGAAVRVFDNSKDFADVPGGYWAATSIDFVTSRGLFNGTSDSTFSPGAPATRAQLMTALARLNGADTSGSALEKGMAWAVAKGISDGTNPNGQITRQQLAAMLWRYAGSPAVSGTLNQPDADQVSGYAVDAMVWAVSQGIVTGNSDGTLNPYGLATRAQMAAMLSRFAAALNG